MCQLLGMNCNSQASITFSFTGFRQRGGRTSHHVDGWGVGFYEPGGCRVFHDDQPASESPLAAFLGDYPIPSAIVISHLRRATQGVRSLANCHPFQREWMGQPWLFSHNGDLRGFEPALTGPFRPIGTTDSERAFCWLMQELRAQFADRVRPVGWAELAPQIALLAERIARHGNFNFLLSSGEALFAHCSSKLYLLQRQHPFPTARLIDCDISLDLGRLNGVDDRMALVATEPLTDAEPWVRLATGEMRVFVGGETVWRQVDPRTQAFAPADEREMVTAG
jgi:glutamine amidotransferase